MEISFIIITNGKKKTELELQVKSILNLNIQNYEIIICGNIDGLNYSNNSKLILIEDKYNAERGSLGGLRNNACYRAKYENIVISDDDMLFPLDWYQNLLIAPSFNILTTCIKNPDGTRFWDNSCYMSPIRGHINLNYNEQDDFMYMSGGQSWIIKKNIWSQVKWNENILIYEMKSRKDYSEGKHNEDTDFSLRCRELGAKITHYPKVLVYHNDKSYSSLGRIIFRRHFMKNPEWTSNLNLPEVFLIDFASKLLSSNIIEGADILRSLVKNGSMSANLALDNYENLLGGKLENSDFSIYDKMYINLLTSLS
jgi:hypothetical protein